MTDQQRADALGCTGGWVRTPNLDAIAAEGVRFDRCVTNSPVCVPARLSLATGLYPHNTGIWDNTNHDMPAETPTWMQVIRDVGYRTSLFGKTHLHHHKGDLRDREHLMHAYGLDDVDEIGGPRASAWLDSHMTERWEKAGLLQAYRRDYEERFQNKPHVARPSTLPLEEYADVYVGQRAKEYLQAYNRPEPWFCWVSFGGPHEPWDAPEPYASMYDPAAMPPPAACPADSGNRPRGVLDQRLEDRPALTPEDIGALRANYAGNVTLIDDQVGKILEVIRDRGEWDRTIVAFVSDHGELNGDAGLLYKNCFLDGSVRVPMILRTPATASASGRVHDGPVELIDLGPTLAGLAGGRVAHRQFGRSLEALLAGPAAEPREFAVSEYQGEAMIEDRKWKMAVNADGEPYLLFDLENDPGETRNLAGDGSHKLVSSQLAQRLHRFRQETTL